MNRDKAKTLVVPHITKVATLIKWVNKHRFKNHDVRKNPAKLLIIDFSKTRFLKPYHIAPLACLIHEYHVQKYTIKLVKAPFKINEYLKSFNFNQFCKKEDINNFPTPSNPQTLPLWRIEQAATSIYPQQAQQYFENNLFDGKSLFSLGNSLAELMNNVFDHSESKIPGFTFTQLNSKNGEIITCVCDFGIGIPRKVKTYLKETGKANISNIDALKKALELSFSTHSKPHNRGFGWDTIFSNIKALNGKLLIVSNNAVFWLLKDGEILTNEVEDNFPGTLVVIYLNAKDLPVREDESHEELNIF